MSCLGTGAKELGETGYWTLTSLTPPEPTPAMKAGSGGVKLGVEEEDTKRVGVLDPPVVMEVMVLYQSGLLDSSLPLSRWIPHHLPLPLPPVPPALPPIPPSL